MANVRSAKKKSNQEEAQGQSGKMKQSLIISLRLPFDCDKYPHSKIVWLAFTPIALYEGRPYPKYFLIGLFNLFLSIKFKIERMNGDRRQSSNHPSHPD